METGGIPGGLPHAGGGVGLVARPFAGPPVHAETAAPTPPPVQSTAFERLRPASWSTAEAARGAELLATGDVKRVIGRTIGNADAKHGTRQLFRVENVHTNKWMHTVLKSLGEGGAQEVFAYDVAVAMGIDDLFPRMAWRAEGGGAAIELFDGRSAADYRIASGRDLDLAFEKMVRARHPDLSDAEVVRRAGVDRQLVHVFDAILANGDRHSQNVLKDISTDELRMIDHGLLNRYPAGEDGLVPKIRAAFAQGERLPDGTRGVELMPEVREHLARVDRDAIVSAFGRMMERIDGSLKIGKETRPMTTSYLDEVLTRLASFTRTGIVRVLTI